MIEEKGIKKLLLSLLNHLDLDGRVKSLLLLGLLGNSLSTHDTTTPVSAVLLILGSVALVDGRNELAELILVLGLDLSQSDSSGGLLVDNSSQTGLALDDGVWHAHLSA